MVTVRPFHVMTHDNTGAVMPKFHSIGAERVADPAQPVFTLDHNVQDTSEENLAKYRRIEEFADSQGVSFFPAGAGIGHQLMVEQGFVHPGRLVVASDSHSNMYGALAAVGTPVVRTDAAALWAGSVTWWLVPRTVKVTLEGTLRPGVTGKDVIITLCGLYNSGEVLNAAVEFHGPGITDLSMSERLTISNMTTEWGALVGWFPFDEITSEYLSERATILAAKGHGERLNAEMIADWEADPPQPDADASYAAEITLDLCSVSPHVAGPDGVGVMHSAAEMANQQIAVHKAYLLSCTNARFNDLVEAASVLRGRKVSHDVELYVAAASAEVQAAAEKDGSWHDLIEAGARPLPPGCGACIGLGIGLLEPGEVGISATNRNFKGRMGSREARAYLASPAVVAASAIAGFITGPEDLGSSVPDYTFADLGWRPLERKVDVSEGFPTSLEGRALLLPVDSLNTDGIYGKDVTYRDDLTPEQMATHAMANYDPEFQEKAREGDILVGGYNFGTGSSREQAATSLKYRGIRLVIAGSFSTTYMRNAFNNGYVCLECPELVEDLRQRFGEDTVPTRRTGIEVTIDFERSVAAAGGKRYAINPLGAAAQELVLAGGLEALVRRNLGL
jgi:homoaconitate hydratase